MIEKIQNYQKFLNQISQDFLVKKFFDKNTKNCKFLYRYHTYKFLASLCINSTIFCVNLNILTDYYHKKGVIDRNFKSSDLDLNIKACTFGSTSTQFNNSFSVVRHEFIELQVRIAIDKYLRSGILKDESEALIKILECFDNGLNPDG